MNNLRLISVLAFCAILATGCMTKGSVVSTSPQFNPVIARSTVKDDLKIGLILRPKIANEVARYLATQGGLTYDFEFNVGQDFLKTFPSYLKSFTNVTLIGGIDEGKGLDYVLDPTVRSSLVGRIKASAAPEYELTLTLESPIIQNGVLRDRVYVSQLSKVDVPAFSNKDGERTDYMTQQYENQLTDLFNDFRIQMRDFLRKNQKP